MFTAIWLALKSVPWPAYALAGLVAIGWGYGHWRYNAGQANVQAKFDSYRSDQKALADHQVAAARAKEAAQAADFAQVASQLAKERFDAHVTASRLSADLAAGRLRLRNDRVRCPAMSQTPAGAGGDHGPGEGELSPTTSEFLVGLANDADNAAEQLTACQSILKSERR